jgi:hypothetical protein
VAAKAIHGSQVEVVYQFSYIPAGEAWPLISNDMVQTLASMGQMSPADAETALIKPQGSDKPQRIDIISLYKGAYSPLVFSSLTEPIATKWGACSSESQRQEFWRARRGRQLHDFVPVSQAWLQSFLIGWFIGRLTGEIRLPQTGSRISVLSDVEIGEWSQFDVLVGVADDEAARIMQGIGRDTGYGLDAIPVLLESMALAWSLSATNPQQPLSHLRAYLAVKTLGDVVNQDPYIWQESPALQAWFTGQPRSGDNQAGLVANDQTSPIKDRLGQARDQLTQFQDYFTQLCSQPISDRDFWTKPRHWEIRHLVLQAIEALIEHVNDPGYLEEDETGLDIPRFPR